VVRLETNTDSVGIGTSSPQAKLDVRGTLNVGEDDTGFDVNFFGASSGGRFSWNEDQMALRAGRDTDGTHWHPDSIGQYSTALGYNTTASGDYGATALGYRTTSSGLVGATALGRNTIASGNYGATALGHYATASGEYGATALGYYTTASGPIGATALGDHATASGYYGATALGSYVEAGPAYCTMVLGHGINHPDSTLVNDINNSLMVGFNSTIPTLFVGPSFGAGTTGNVGIATTSPARALHINDIMRLEPRSTFPSLPSDGDVCVVGDAGSRHAYCYLNGGWQQLD
jgi:hypothetical protein